MTQQGGSNIENPANAKGSGIRTAPSLYASSTQQSADSVEAHPTLDGRFALGTYQIEQQESNLKNDSEKGQEGDPEDKGDAPPISRKGLLRLMQSKEYHKDGQRRIDVETLDTVETAAILDMKWLHPNTSLLSVALADSSLSIFKSSSEAATSSGTLQRIAHARINSTNALCLSLDWSDRKGGFIGGYDISQRLNTNHQQQKESLTASVIVSQSDGTVTCIPNAVNALQDEKLLAQTQITWSAHAYEAWCAAYDCWSEGQVVWSGGDDLSLKGWDIRTLSCSSSSSSSSSSSRSSFSGDGGNDFATPTFSITRGFDGGVTCMQSHHLRQHLWAVGSYDERVRLFDARQTRKPLSETHVGGGLWRIKWHPNKRDTLLVGCMHDGFKVLTLDADATAKITVNNDDWNDSARKEMNVVTRFDEHDSLAYGCDWDRGQGETSDIAYSCSFYDAMLHAWSSSL